MNFEELKLVRLTLDHEIKPFDCEDSDLNDFLHNDAKNYSNDLFAVTYLLEYDNKTVAFYSLLNDKISFIDVQKSKTAWESFCEVVTSQRPLKSYPAVKIGRLGVSKDIKNRGIGTFILDSIKILFITNNRTGCRCLTVDAYSQSLDFYQKNDFKYLTHKDQNKDTRLMYYDLRQIQ